MTERNNLLAPWYVGDAFIGGVPIYFADGRHFCTVSRGLDFDAHVVARAIVDAVNTAYNKERKESHAQG